VNVRKVDHLGIAVHSIEEASRLFIDVLGGEFVAGGDEDRRGIRTVQIRLGGFKLELMQPLDDGSYLARYLARYGQGFHHMTVFVDDVVEAVATLEAAGYEVVDTNLANPSWKETYLRPRSGFGTLIQLAETDMTWQESYPGVTLESVLAGAVHNVPRGFALRTTEAG
jgi:methylmalonyl-CoA/ethylmalonyl-CoA epimerase